ncbi:MAG: hypothetical protein ABI134_11355 [Byssovorax sp.]
MNRVVLGSLFSIFAMVSSVGTAWGSISSFDLDNQLDDTCNVFVNGAYAARVNPLSYTPGIYVGPSVVPGRTNILLRCSDGGVYATSVEAVAQHCSFTLDEEGRGLTGECY